MKPGIWGQTYLTAYRRTLSDRLINGEELTEADRHYLAKMLTPKVKPEKKPEGRPKGSKTTEARDLHLCIEYLDLYSTGGSDSAFMVLASKHEMKESLVRKVVGGSLLDHVKVLYPFILREEEIN